MQKKTTLFKLNKRFLSLAFITYHILNSVVQLLFKDSILYLTSDIENNRNMFRSGLVNNGKEKQIKAIEKNKVGREIKLFKRS